MNCSTVSFPDGTSQSTAYVGQTAVLNGDLSGTLDVIVADNNRFWDTNFALLLDGTGNTSIRLGVYSNPASPNLIFNLVGNFVKNGVPQAQQVSPTVDLSCGANDFSPGNLIQGQASYFQRNNEKGRILIRYAYLDVATNTYNECVGNIEVNASPNAPVFKYQFRTGSALHTFSTDTQAETLTRL